MAKKEADTITNARYISGFPTSNNLDKWASYAKQNSFDPKESRAQSKRDLSEVKAGGRINSDDWQREPNKPYFEGRGWVHEAHYC